MTTRVKEIVGYTDLIDPQELLPDLRQIELDQIVTAVTGNRLQVRTKTGVLTSGEPDIQVQVTYVTVRELQIISGAELSTDTPITGDKLEVSVKGSGLADIEVDVTIFSCNVVSNGKLNVSGRAKTNEATVNTAGKLRAFGLRCENVYVQIGSGGSGEVYATELIEGTVKSAGGLDFKGRPNKERVQTSGGGKARQAD